MKKMMIIAALIGGMLMPAQIMAQNNKNAKPKVENRNNKKGNGKDFKQGRNKKNDNRDRKYSFNAGKPGKNNRPVVVAGRPQRPKPPVVINRPAPRPLPPPPPRKAYCSNDAANVAATVVSLAALIALIAD